MGRVENVCGARESREAAFPHSGANASGLNPVLGARCPLPSAQTTVLTTAMLHTQLIQNFFITTPYCIKFLLILNFFRFESKPLHGVHIREGLNKLAKARKTRTSPGTLGLKKFGLGKL